MAGLPGSPWTQEILTQTCKISVEFNILSVAWIYALLTTAVRQHRAVPRNTEGAEAFAANVPPLVRQLPAAGVTGLRASVEALNKRGVRTARGGEWHATTVRNLLARA